MVRETGKTSERKSPIHMTKRDFLDFAAAVESPRPGNAALVKALQATRTIRRA